MKNKIRSIIGNLGYRLVCFQAKHFPANRRLKLFAWRLWGIHPLLDIDAGL